MLWEGGGEVGGGGSFLSLNITGLTMKRFFVTFTFMKQGTYKLK